MSGINKLSFLGRAMGMALGVVFSGAAFATGPITDTFSTGGTLTATQMNNLKNAVNDLQGNVPSTSCRTNAGAVDSAAVRVGPLCVESTRRAASDTWATAVTTCTTAGKRLPTPAEYMAIKGSGLVSDMATNGEFEWVDAATSSHTADNTIPGAGAGRLRVGYMGPHTAVGIGGVAADGDIFFATNIAYDVGQSYIYYRCVR